MKFFFDTANYKSIENIWAKIRTDKLKNNIAGITTNPKSLSQIFNDDFNLSGLKQILIDLNNTLNDISGNNEHIIYIQIPNDIEEPNSINSLINFIKELNFKVGIKIPHYPYFLKLTKQFDDISFNVTGISDLNTCGRALSYKHIDYVSIIPGRMDTIGIDYISFMNFLKDFDNFQERIIAGSMRDLNQLVAVLNCGCIPTIGETAFNHIIPELNAKNLSFCDILFRDIANNACNTKYTELTSGNQLSKDFFIEMNQFNKLKL